MDNNMMYNQGQKKTDVFGLVGMICSAVSLLMAVLGTTFTCACSASRIVKKGDLAMHPVFILSIFAVIIAVVGIVFGVIAVLKNRKSKFGMLAVVIGAVAFIYGLLPMMTICSYNCSLESAFKKMLLG